MSMLHRGGSQRRLHDFYETPEWTTESIIRRLPSVVTGHYSTLYDRVLEPAAGNGAIIRVMRRLERVRSLTTVELEPARSLYLKTRVRPNRHFSGDFRSFANLEEKRIRREVDERDMYGAPLDDIGYTLILTNPPFSLAETFLLRSLPLLTPEIGYLVMLLRLAFVESKGRAELHRKYPSDIHVLPERPSFTGDGQSDMSAYAWFVWGPGCGGRWSMLPDRQPARLLPPTFYDAASRVLTA